MADTKKKKKGFLKQSVKKLSKGKESGFGKYDENTGGGEPIVEEGSKPGQKGSGSGRGAWERHGKEERREPDQPRTKDGKFTYNSVNGKELKEISKVHGESRGTTVPPTLTGGKNGIQYYEKDKNNGHRKVNKDGSLGGVIEGADDRVAELLKIKPEEVWRKGDVVAFKDKVGVARGDMIESAQKYIRSKGEREIADKLGTLKAERGRLTKEEFAALSDEEKANYLEERNKQQADVKKQNEGIRDTQKESGVFGKGEFEDDRPSTWDKRVAEGKTEEAAVKHARKPGMSGKKLIPGEREYVKQEKFDKETPASKEKKEGGKKAPEKKEPEKAPEKVTDREKIEDAYNKLKESPNYKKFLNRAKEKFGDIAESDEIALKMYIADRL